MQSRFFQFLISFFKSYFTGPRAGMKVQSLGSNLNMDWGSPSPLSDGGGHYLVVGNKNDQVLVIDIRTGNQLKKRRFNYEVLVPSFISLCAYVNYMCFNPLSFVMFLRHFDIVFLSSFLCFQVNELAWSYNGNYILAACGSTDGYGGLDILSFSPDNELELVDTILAHSTNCMQLKIDPSYQRMAISSYDQGISIWDIDTMISTHTITVE
jgi:WD40 repeat protein